MFALNINLRVQCLYPGYLEQNRMDGRKYRLQEIVGSTSAGRD